jgi:hypothetical protein
MCFSQAGAFKMEMTLVQRVVAFLAIIFLFLVVCFAWAANPLRLATLSSEYSERAIVSPGVSRGFRIFDFDPGWPGSIRRV